MRIKAHTIYTEYSGKDGTLVVLAVHYPESTADVVAYDANKQQVFNMVYNNRAGAMIGIGRRFGHVRFARMYEKRGWQ